MVDLGSSASRLYIDCVGSYPPKWDEPLRQHVDVAKIWTPELLTADDLLWWADSVSDHSPSPHWIPPFSAMLVACDLRIANFREILDRLDMFAREVSALMTDPAMRALAVTAFSEITDNWLGEFPFGEVNRDANELPLVIPCAIHRDEFLGTAIAFTESTFGKDCIEQKPLSIISRWAGEVFDKVRSAGFLVSVSHCWLHRVGEFNLYKYKPYVCASMDRQLLSMHYQKAHSVLVDAYPERYMEWFDTQFT